ncbi:MAG: flagellar biosynthetic protein FliO [Candidatus Thiodiazotropha sp.]
MNSYFIDILYTFSALAVVVAMIWFLIKALKGLYRSHGNDNPIQLIRTLPVGTRERLLIFTYRDSEYLVGVSANGMSLLDKLPIQNQTPSSDIQTNKDTTALNLTPPLSNPPSEKSSSFIN